MTNPENMILIKNEIENYITTIANSFKMSDTEMMFVVDSVLGTLRHKALTREIYNRATQETHEITEERNREKEVKEKEGGDVNGNPNEKG